MKSKKIKIAGAIAAAAFAAILTIPYMVDVDEFRPKLESFLQSSLGREVRIGYLELSVLSGGLRADDLSIGEDPAFGPGPFLHTKSLGVGVSLSSLIFSRSLHVTSLTIKEPRVMLTRSASGRWNFSSFGGTTAANSTAETAESSLSSLVLDRLRITNATILIGSPDTPQSTELQDINLDLKNASFDGVMSFVASAQTEAGKIELRGEAGPINRTDPEQTPFHATLGGIRADLARITGTSARKKSPSALEGILTLNAIVNSDGNTIHSEGTAAGTKLRLVTGGQAARQPVSLRYATDYSFIEKKGTLHDCRISVRNSAALVSGSYEMHGENLVTHLKLSGSQLALDDVAGVLPALGIVLPGTSVLVGGTASANLSLDGPLGHLVTTGNVQVSGAHLTGLDLGSKLSSIPGMKETKLGSDLFIVSLSTRFRVAPQGTQVSNLNSQISALGGLTGDGNIDASNRLNFHMVARVAGDGALRSGLNFVHLQAVPDEVPFLIQGTTSDPIFLPDVNGLAKSAAKSAAKEAVKKMVASSAKKNPAVNDPPAASPLMAQQKSNRGGFFHRIFGRKNKQNSQPSGTQMAAQRVKF